MQRRQFLKTIFKKAGALLALPLIPRCGANPFTYGLHSTPGFDDHTHSVSIPCVVLDEAPDTFTMETSWTSFHNHTITLTKAQILDLQAGNEIIVVTDNTTDHTHEFTIPHTC